MSPQKIASIVFLLLTLVLSLAISGIPNRKIEAALPSAAADLPDVATLSSDIDGFQEPIHLHGADEPSSSFLEYSTLSTSTTPYHGASPKPAAPATNTHADIFTRIFSKVTDR
jgi:hypothetical protein